MIERFWEFVVTEDPVFMTGFNDSGFDIPYIRDKQLFYASGAEIPKKMDQASAKIIKRDSISARYLIPLFCFLEGQ